MVPRSDDSSPMEDPLKERDRVKRSRSPGRVAGEAPSLDQQSVRVLIEHCPAGIAVFDRRGTRIECNQRFADVFHATPEELTPGPEWLALLPKTWRSRGARGWNKVKDNASFTDHQAVVRIAGGTPKTLAVSGRISEKGVGDNHVFVVAVQDISAWKRRMDRVRNQIARSKSRFRDLYGLYGRAREMHEASREEVRRLQDGLKKVNQVTKILMEDFQQQKRDMEERIRANFHISVLPLLHELRATKLTPSQQHLVATLDFTIRHITSYFGISLGKPRPRLSPREIDICRMISEGKDSREIAEAAGIAYQTVIVHRKNIRKKLGIKKSKQNLASFIQHNL